MARTPFRYRIAEFPTVRGNLFLVPLALFLIPLMPATEPHPSVFFTLEDFELIVCLCRIFFQDVFIFGHVNRPSAPFPI